jgi:hypothetical protein
MERSIARDGDARPRRAPWLGRPGERRRVLLLRRSDSTLGLGAVAEAARHTPGWVWTVLLEEHAPAAVAPRGLRVRGSGADPRAPVEQADVVIAEEGHGSLRAARGVEARLLLLRHEPLDGRRVLETSAGSADAPALRRPWPPAPMLSGVLREALAGPARRIAEASAPVEGTRRR